MPLLSHPVRLQALAVLLALGIAGPALADDPQPTDHRGDPAPAGALIRERQTNAWNQHEGRPSVWMAVPAGATAQRPPSPRIGPDLPPPVTETSQRPD